MEGIAIKEIAPFTLVLQGANFNDQKKVQRVMDACHKHKHLFMEGYPCGRKTRKKMGGRMKKWPDYPGICFTYLVTAGKNDTLTVRVLVSSVEDLLTKYTRGEIGYYVQMYLQGVAEEIIEKNEEDYLGTALGTIRIPT